MVRFVELPDDSPELVQKPDDGVYFCPVCRDYTGNRTSVEAHIPGKSDPAHKGLVGKDFRVVSRHGPDRLSIHGPVIRKEGEKGNGVTFLPGPDSDNQQPDSSPSPEQETGSGLFAAGVLVGILVWVLRSTGNDDRAAAMLR